MLSLVLLAVLGGCRKSDAERAAEERAKIEEKLRDSYTLVPIFLQTRAAIILGQALIARAGGPEGILVTLLGPERAKEVYSPLAWLDRVRQGMGEVSPEQVASGAGDALGAAREAGGKGWEALKRKLGATISGGTADSGPK